MMFAMVLGLAHPKRTVFGKHLKIDLTHTSKIP